MTFVKNKPTALAKLSDKELVETILATRQRAELRRLQEELYERYADRIFRRCLQLLRNKDVAKDLTHDVFIKIFLNLSKFRGESSFFSWVYAITYNHCLTYLEKEKKLKLENLDTHGFDLAIDDIELEHKVLQEIRLTQLERLMEQLDDSERLILLMRYRDGMSIKDIAKSLGIGISAVKMRLKRSRDHLAELFNS